MKPATRHEILYGVDTNTRQIEIAASLVEASLTYIAAPRRSSVLRIRLTPGPSVADPLLGRQVPEG